ncbi:hypothetical protein C0J52_08229 [Blattella germanica]|nr:hypothetical protein C0J52_08229 [Blattella germanica]
MKKLASIKMPLSPEDSAKAAVLVEEGRSYRYVAEWDLNMYHFVRYHTLLFISKGTTAASISIASDEPGTCAGETDGTGMAALVEPSLPVRGISGCFSVTIVQDNGAVIAGETLTAAIPVEGIVTTLVVGTRTLGSETDGVIGRPSTAACSKCAAGDKIVITVASIAALEIDELKAPGELMTASFMSCNRAFLSFVAMGTIITKMATPQQKAFCVLKFESCKSVITVQRAFLRQFNCDPPNANNIHQWHNQLATTGCLCKGKSVGRPRVSEENVQRVLDAFVRSPNKSVRKASRELALPVMTINFKNAQYWKFRKSKDVLDLTTQGPDGTSSLLRAAVNCGGWIQWILNKYTRSANELIFGNLPVKFPFLGTNKILIPLLHTVQIPGYLKSLLYLNNYDRLFNSVKFNLPPKKSVSIISYAEIALSFAQQLENTYTSTTIRFVQSGH